MSEYSIAPEYLKTYQKAIADISHARQDNPTFDDVIKVRILTFFLNWMSKHCPSVQWDVSHFMQAFGVW